MNQNRGIDHLSKERIWSESVYADCVSPDGKTGFMLRLGRYPDQNTSWLWAFAFLPDRTYGYNDHYLPCPGDALPVEEPDLSYELIGDAQAVFQRKGSRDKPAGARVSVSVNVTGDVRVPHGPGSEPMIVEADFLTRHMPWRINPYRSEWIGDVEGTIAISGNLISVKGLGHWHEQHQKAPRFQIPFVYLSLRGEDLTFVGTATEPNDLGYLVSEGETKKIRKIEIAPPAESRNIRLTLKDNATLEGVIKTVHHYSVPIYRLRRPGTLVTARFGGGRLSGCVNDWQIAQRD